MPWALLSLLALILASGAAPAKTPGKPSASRNETAAPASVYLPSPMYDVEAEQQLLELANQARARAGTPPLQSDSGLTAAARAHASAMAQSQQLTHQFEWEPTLSNRLASGSSLHLDRAAENVALDGTAADAHAHLMLSPPHRENLLDPSYNVAGFGVVREGSSLYVVEDFGHSLPVYSSNQSEELIAGALNQLRVQANLPELVRTELPGLREAVCSMALEDRLATRPMRDFGAHYAVLTYANLHPEILPANAGRFVNTARVSHMSVSVCYARSAAYPSGAYWVGLLVQ